MHYNVLFFIALLKFGTIKAEPIEFSRKNGRVEMIFPAQNKGKDDALHATDKHVEDINELQEWSNVDVKPNNFNDEYESGEYEFPDDQFKSIEHLDDTQSARFSNYLLKLLQRPGVWEAPLILIKDSQDNMEDRLPLELDGLQGISKRSRYYRKYPWPNKRQNSRPYNNMDYDPYNPCNPSRRDVFELLVALHEARQGNKSRFVNFCNRKRPASAVYTNIRFLGRRRK